MQSGHVREGGQRPGPQQLRPARRQRRVQGKDILINIFLKVLLIIYCLEYVSLSFLNKCVTFFPKLS